MPRNGDSVKRGWETRRARAQAAKTAYMLSPEQREREMLQMRETNERGAKGGFASGTKLTLQAIQEEYVPALSNLIDRVTVYERMDNDSSVKSILRGNIYPLISSSRWEVEGGIPEHRDLVSANILRKGDRQFWCSTPFEQRLFEQGQQLKYGFMGFGKTRAVVEGVTIYETLKYLHPRSFGSPHGPWEWDSAGGNLAAVHRNYLYIKGDRAEFVADERIPIEEVFLGVWEMAGDNWEGKALIRPAYKDWAMKEQGEKIGMVHLQNVGVGIPYGKLAPGGGPGAARNMEMIVKSHRGGSKERAYFVLNDGEEVGFLTVDSSSDLSAGIVDQHARGIAAAGTMQFLGDGNTESGSRASGSVHMVAYLQGVEAIRIIFQEQLNHGWGSQLGLVEDLIYGNYDEVEECPRIIGSPISPNTQLENASMIGDLIQKGGISKDLGAENYLRKALGMPPISAQDFQNIVDKNLATPSIGGRPNEVGPIDRQDPRNDNLGRAVGLRGNGWDGEKLPLRNKQFYPWQKSKLALLNSSETIPSD